MVTSVAWSVLLESDDVFTGFIGASDAAHVVAGPDSGGRDEPV